MESRDRLDRREKREIKSADYYFVGSVLLAPLVLRQCP